MRLSLFLFILLPANPAAAQIFCHELFNNTQRVSFKDIGFAQNFLGHAWADYQLRKFENDYNIWLETNPYGNRQQYILKQTENKPFPVFRDPDGQLRKFDKHHKHKVYQTFMGRRDFSVYVTVVFDYTKPNPKTSKPWKKREMMAHATQNGFISFFGIENPGFRDLKNLPENIEYLPDLPIRSLISFIFENLPLPLKGNDFQPMIQIRLAGFITAENIHVRSEHPFHKSNIDEITEQFFKNPKILQFLLDRINPKAPKKRREEVSSFLKEHLNQTPNEAHQSFPPWIRTQHHDNLPF